MVDWDFLFEGMGAMGFSNEFSLMIQLFFIDAKACEKINWTLLQPFIIERRVQQGYSLAPYHFLIIAEVVNTMIMRKVELGDIRGI